MTETVGFNEQTRSLYSLDAMGEREKGLVLAQLFAYWEALPPGWHGLPNIEDCPPKLALTGKIADQICCLDTNSENLLNYIVRDHATSTIPGFGSELVARPLCDRRGLDTDTTACAVEFRYCKYERTPNCHEIEQILSGLKRHYTRIMVPVEDDSGDVCRIYFAMCELQPIKRVTFRVIVDS